MARVLRIAALVIELAWAVALLLLGSNAGLTVWALLLLFWGGIAVAVLAAARGLIALVRPESALRGRGGRAFVAEALLLGLVAASVWTGLAFRIRFVVSLPWLSSYATSSVASHRAGQEPAVPKIVGLFHVREAEVLPEGSVRLITTECMFDHCGMVFSPDRRPPVIGEDTYTRLGLGWWHWWRSW